MQGVVIVSGFLLAMLLDVRYHISITETATTTTTTGTGKTQTSSMDSNSGNIGNSGESRCKETALQFKTQVDSNSRKYAQSSYGLIDDLIDATRCLYPPHYPTLQEQRNAGTKFRRQSSKIEQIHKQTNFHNDKFFLLLAVVLLHATISKYSRIMARKNKKGEDNAKRKKNTSKTEEEEE
ncbi:hypothetical protein RFI_28742 [Reticulomyxa filosa]|uniref:Uncharacterized protein n=1 Tax=Reticulomyxa filosa TaxID=46433 RepID=X6M6J1_RETFI|nr:hypothetical protein RFI_28742 [Reticulomyxa filosa]|eukprot:ETO08645.1 hypothetical protein RFI_28742 [Reticulomyxa filosa]